MVDLLTDGGGKRGRFTVVYGVPGSLKTEVVTSGCISAARQDVLCHYLDVNLSLEPEFLLDTIDESDFPLRIYRPADVETAEMVMELLSATPNDYRELVVLDSVLMMGRTVFLRSLEVDPLYVFSLLRRFSFRPKKSAVAIVETKKSDIFDSLTMEAFRDQIDQTVLLYKGREDIVNLSISRSPFDDSEQAALEVDSLPTTFQ